MSESKFHSEGSAGLADEHQNLMAVLEPALQTILDVTGLRPAEVAINRAGYRTEAEIVHELQALAESLHKDGIEATASSLAQDCATEAQRLARLFRRLFWRVRAGQEAS